MSIGSEISSNTPIESLYVKTPILLLKKQNFSLIKTASLFLYIVLFSIIPLVFSFLLFVKDQDFNSSILVFSILLFYIVVHEFVIYSTYKFVTNNFEQSEYLTFYAKGTAFGFPLFLFCIFFYVFVNSSNSELLYSAKPVIILFSVIGGLVSVVSIIMLYDQIRISTEDFTDELILFFNNDYSVFVKYLLLGFILLEKFSIFLRMPLYLMRLFNEAKFYSSIYGYKDEKD